jgi:hypothetical protein
MMLNMLGEKMLILNSVDDADALVSLVSLYYFSCS